MLYYIKIEREDRSIRFDLIKKQHICYAQSSRNFVPFIMFHCLQNVCGVILNVFSNERTYHTLCILYLIK